MSKTIVKLCWFHADKEQYSAAIKDISNIIVQNVGAAYDECFLCQKYGKLKDFKEGVA